MTSFLRSAVRADDPEAVAIAIAADETPDAARVGRRLDALALSIAPSVMAKHGFARLEPLVRAVYGELEFSTPDAYDDPRLSLIDRVVETREGSPVALAVVLMALGRRLGVPLRGVAFPGHFMVRFEATEAVFVDPASGAFPFPARALLQLAADELRANVAEAERFLQPVGARTVGVRLLRNLQRAHEARGDLGRAMLVADRLYEITGSPTARCDRGLRAAMLGAPHGALDDLTAYLSEHRDRAVSDTAALIAATSLDLN